MRLIIGVFFVLGLAGHSLAEDEDEVFSGPQVSERLVSFKAQGVLGDLADKEIDLVGQADGKPIAIVFVHKLTRPSAALTRAVMTYGAKFVDEEMTCGVVFLSDDDTATSALIKRASHALPKVPVVISSDGAEGPGAYGLNRKVTLTILVAKKNKVTANFALIQPSVQADAPKIGRAIAQAVGKDETPTLAQMGVKGRYAPNKPRGTNDPQFESLLRAVIQKEQTKEDVSAAAKKFEEYIAEKPAAKKRIGEITNRIISAGVLERYGTETAREFLKKWAKEYAPQEESKSP